MITGGDERLQRLTRYLFTAPGWPFSLIIVLVLGLLIDGAFIGAGRGGPAGTLGFTLPALAAFLVTKPAVGLIGRKMTWNRSALLALACTLFGIIITLIAVLIAPALLPLFFAISLGFVLGIRLIVLAAIADYRLYRVAGPAAVQSVAGAAAGAFLFPPPFLTLSAVLIVIFLVAAVVFIWLIERPLARGFGITGLSFLNSFIDLSDGSRGMEEFFREIGEEVYVPQVNFFFRSGGERVLTISIPNVHPGPLGEIGGGIIPAEFGKAFPGMVMVPHGAATHDFNLVSSAEIGKLIDAVKKTEEGLAYREEASRSARLGAGSVSILVQRFGDALLIVSTRSPEETEDLDVSIGLRIMAEGHRVTPHLGFVDAHNCMKDDIVIVTPATLIATEYFRACVAAIERFPTMETAPFLVGTSRVPLPFTRDQGFGDLGLQVCVVGVAGQKTAYVLFDGNNIAAGAREIFRDRLLAYVDDAEIMTTDSHVVNTISGKNPVGMKVSPDLILPYLARGVEEAIGSMKPAEVAASTACAERVVVFGSSRIAQLSGTVNTMLVLMPPLSAALLLLALLLSFVAYLFIG